MLAGVLNSAELLVASLIERCLVFYPRYQPADLDVLLKRHLWLNRVRQPRGVVVPNRFRVTLDAATHDDFQPILALLAEELAASLDAYCRRLEMSRLGPFRIEFQARADLRRGRIEIETGLEEDENADQPGETQS